MLKALRNRLGFTLRKRLRWEPGTYRERVEPKTDLPLDNEARDAAKRLAADYDLSAVYESASRERYLETLTYLDWLDLAWRIRPDAFDLNTLNQPFRWLDAGAKNWSYVAAISAFIERHFPGAYRLDGVELDVHRRYVDLHTRRQAAQTYISLLPNAHYHEGDIREWTQPAHVITHFMPFVFEDPLLAWGLPPEAFRPREILLHLLGLLTPGGLLLIVNQGETEAHAQKTLLEDAPQQLCFRYQSLGQLPARFIQYRYPRYGWLCMKDVASDARESGKTAGYAGYPQ